ncbi:conserved hypothetical protein [Actinopolymorpha cephalotaxi]|uniref:Uncharacterized protein (TIGR02246 family) n=1 Tax=Actinopolymorpha cephalotaxi TaxID=504797 RepID=A0A1I2N0P3_9ACTN|nr:SgcJ/EcaC family oxidoreductase [Actinopolymorpha cephalotaxi]NYH85823.1 uncharacterized protein (TIGR02246 family) [Actinopolymorpha cephalotaxi]SFF95267.1 conserved hypothetical protein [Actinopolymorpha cephalotaxi]
MASDISTAEVVAVIDRLREAWRAADIDAYVAGFDEDADLVNRTGQWCRGRKMIAERLGELARTGRPAVFAAERRTEAVRIVTPELAVVHESWIEPDRVAHATYVLVRKDEGWRVTTTNVVLRQ